MSDKPKGKRHVSLVALIAPVAIVVLAVIISYGVNERFQTELLHRFKHDADNVLMKATNRLDNYRELLYGGRAFVMSSDAVSANEWRTFYNQQSIFARFPGVSSIAYIKSVPTSELPAFERQMQGNEYFGPTYKLKPQSNRDIHGLMSMYVSENDLSPIIGLDLFKQDDRRVVYRAAEANGSVVASPPMKMATGYQGYFSILPTYVDDRLDGYVLLSFRYADQMKQLFPDANYGYKVTDVSGNVPVDIYTSSGFDTGGYQQTSTIDVGGREWQVAITRAIDKRPVGYLLPQAIIATGVVLASAIYMMPRNRFRRK